MKMECKDCEYRTCLEGDGLNEYYDGCELDDCVYHDEEWEAEKRYLNSSY
jgi:hypothetical protein